MGAGLPIFQSIDFSYLFIGNFATARNLSTRDYIHFFIKQLK